MRVQERIMLRPFLLLPLLTIIAGESLFNIDVICDHNTPCIKTELNKSPTAEHGENNEHTLSLDSDKHEKSSYNGKPNNIYSENSKTYNEIKAITDDHAVSDVLNGKIKANLDGNLNVRNRRSSSAGLLKALFVKSTAPSEYEEENESSEDTTLTTLRQQSTPSTDLKDETGSELTHLIHKLNETLEMLDEKLLNLSERESSHGYLLVKIPLAFSHIARNHRLKREVTDKNKVKLGNTTVLTHVTETADGNNTVTHESITNVTVKIDSVLKEVQNHITAIKSIKDISSEMTFNVGYVVASLETLELTLKKLIRKMNAQTNRSDAWAQKILVKVELSKAAVSNLMDYLRMYIDLPTESGNKV